MTLILTKLLDNKYHPSLNSTKTTNRTPSGNVDSPRVAQQQNRQFTERLTPFQVALNHQSAQTEDSHHRNR